MNSENTKIPRPICWFEIPVKNTLKAREFYAKLFNWTYEEFIDFETDYWTINSGDGSLVGGFVKTNSEIITNGVVLFMNVDNIQETIKQALELGAMLIEKESVITNYAGRHAKIQDLDGNTIGLWSK